MSTARWIRVQGTTHVAVGFNDLGMLLTCDLREAPGGKCSNPLRFVGIDASAFSVAKSLVLAEMLRMLGEHLQNDKFLVNQIQSVLPYWKFGIFGPLLWNRWHVAIMHMTACFWEGMLWHWMVTTHQHFQDEERSFGALPPGERAATTDHLNEYLINNAFPAKKFQHVSTKFFAKFCPYRFIPRNLEVWYSATCSKAASKNFAHAASQTLVKVKHEKVRHYGFSGGDGSTTWTSFRNYQRQIERGLF